MTFWAEFIVILVVEVLFFGVLYSLYSLSMSRVVNSKIEHFVDQKKCSFGHHDFSGLGDRLLDTIGYCVVCKRKSPKVRPVVNWCGPISDFNSSRGRSPYSLELFDFPFETTCSHDFMRTRHSGYSYNPYGVADMFGIEIDDELIDDFISLAMRIRPSAMLDVPSEAELKDVVGIHLRKSDRILDSPDDSRHASATSTAELLDIMTKLKERAMGYERGQRFFVCSENSEHRAEFVAFLIDAQRDYVIVEAESRISPDVADFFYLTRCKEILQGIKYSTFSISAAIIGQKPLINFASRDYKTTNNFLNYWAPLLVNHPRGEYGYWRSSPHKIEIDLEYVHTVEGDIDSATCPYPL